MSPFKIQRSHIGSSFIYLTIIIIFSGMIGCGSDSGGNNINGDISDNTLSVSPSIGPISSEKIVVDDDGNRFVVNQVLLTFPNNTDRTIVNSVVSSIDGNIIGFIQNPDTYQVELNITSVDELQTIITKLRQDSRILLVRRHLIYELENAFSDTEILIKDEPMKGWAYDKIKIVDAWKTIEQAKITPNPITVAVIDSGLDKNHSEFKNLIGKTIFGANLLFSLDPKGNSYLDVSEWMDKDGHGSAVSGIIGAANNGEGMNGILSGLANPNYLMHVYRAGNDKCPDNPEKKCLSGMAIYNAIKLATTIGGAKVVNLSSGFLHKTTEDWEAALDFYEKLFSSAPTVLFVASAGNDKREALMHLPSAVGVNGKVSNIISVGATDLSDKRGSVPICVENGVSRYPWLLNDLRICL